MSIYFFYWVKCLPKARGNVFFSCLFLFAFKFLFSRIFCNCGMQGYMDICIEEKNPYIVSTQLINFQHWRHLCHWYPDWRITPHNIWKCPLCSHLQGEHDPSPNSLKDLCKGSRSWLSLSNCNSVSSLDKLQMNRMKEQVNYEVKRPFDCRQNLQQISEFNSLNLKWAIKSHQALSYLSKTMNDTVYSIELT